MHVMMKIQDELPSVILAALAKLDEKGTDEKVTQAMAVVLEAFRMNTENQCISPDELLEAAMNSLSFQNTT